MTVATSPSRVGPVAVARTDELATKRQILATFVRLGSPRVAVSACALAVVLRVVFGGALTFADAAVVLGVAAIVGPFEWVVHLWLLHAPDDSFRTRRLGTGVGHREHHLDPQDMQWVLLRGVDALTYLPILAVFNAVLAIPVLWLTGSTILGPYLLMLAASFAALVHYEWTHLLVHTRYRPATRYYKRLARNHRLHHYRNERYWLGVTSNSGDRLLGTLPASKSDVTLSETARTLSR